MHCPTTYRKTKALSPEITLNQNRNLAVALKIVKYPPRKHYRGTYSCLISRICLSFLSKIICLENSSTLRRSLFLNKVASLQLDTLFKKDSGAADFFRLFIDINIFS